jgi:hypothetical protein
MSKHSKQNSFDDELEQLLQSNNFVQPPQQFTHNVMASINGLPDVHPNYPTWWQWLALIGGGVPALMQTVAFMFSAWNIANIG